MGNIGDFVNLPSKSAELSTALSTTVTAAFPNAYYKRLTSPPDLASMHPPEKFQARPLSVASDLLLSLPVMLAANGSHHHPL